MVGRNAPFHTTGNDTMRERSTNQLSNPSAVRYYTYTDGHTENVETTVGPHVGVYKTFQDVVTPGFRRKVSNGELIVSPMDSFTAIMSYGGNHIAQGTFNKPNPPGGLVSDTQPFRFTRIEGALSWVQPVLIPHESDKTKAVTQAFARANRPDVQGLVFLGELKKVLFMLRHPLSAIEELHAAMRRRIRNREIRELWDARRYYDAFVLDSSLEGMVHRRKGYTHKRTITPGRLGMDQAVAYSSLWLQWRYGVLPLIMDMQGTLKALSRLHTSVRQTYRGKERSSDRSVVTSSQGYNSWWLYTITKVHEEELNTRAGVLLQLDADLMDRFGMKLYDVPSSVYELIPYSFVVDWFLNLGDVIAALTPRADVSNKVAWCTRRRMIVVERTVSNFRSPDADWSATMSLDGFHDRCDLMGVTRDVVTSADIGFGLTFDISKTHLIDAIALIIQRIAPGKTNRGLRV